MIRRHTASILHPPPVRPARRRLAPGSVPDALAPDDVVNPEAGRVIHDPFGDRLSDGIIGLITNDISFTCSLSSPPAASCGKQVEEEGRRLTPTMKSSAKP